MYPVSHGQKLTEKMCLSVVFCQTNSCMCSCFSPVPTAVSMTLHHPDSEANLYGLVLKVSGNNLLSIVLT